jgi:glycerate dehydrogenase
MSTPRIVFLDRDTTDAGDLDLSDLESLGEVTYHALSQASEVPDRIAEANIVLTNKVVIDAAAMDAAPSLQVIQVVATGMNNVDLDAAAERGIEVFNVSGYSTPGVAQHVFALVLNLVTHVNRYANEPELWAESPMFTRLDYPITELKGKTFGIVGYGDIGREVGKIAEAFGMRVVALAREGSDSSGPVPRLAREEFYRSCDVISLHCPLTPDNERMINRETLNLMKPSAFLINTGRGGLVAEADLVEALQSGTIAGAGVDVVSVEPPGPDHPLITNRLPNLLVTPHTAWSSREARERLMAGVVENLRSFLGRQA